MRASLTLGLVILVGCGTDGPSQQWVANFNPPAVKAGYTRFVTPTVKDLEPGADVEYCQWIAAPSDKDRDVLDLTGMQSPTGHHAVLYATTETNFKVGESHICTVQDMISISFVGGIGGDGASGAAQLPAGLYFRLPAGMALMANTHWLNATDSAVDGQAVIDVEFASASPDRKIADLFANNGDVFPAIAPGQSASYDVNCTFPQDLNLAMVSDHMHNYGTKAYTEIIHSDGTKERIADDPTWQAEQQFNPKYTAFSADAPKVVHAGDTYHTHCEWTNTSTKAQQFPDEMCVGFAFYFPSQGQIICENGGWGM